jgi:hypothetical protein
MVGGHCNLPDSGHQAGTAAVTDGEWSPGVTGLRSAPNDAPMLVKDF